MNYILFEYDHGGINNIIISFKFIVFLASITNRTIVIPPAQPIDHVNFELNNTGENTILSSTKLDDLLDFESDVSFRNLVNIISFNDFIKNESTNLNLPSNFNNFNRIESDYQTMLVQGNRLYNKKDARGKYWLQRAETLKLSPDISSNKDWVIYSIKNFKTMGRSNVEPFLQNILKLKDKVIFFPMDVNIYTIGYKFPRIFDLVSNYIPKLDTYRYLWTEINSLSYHNKYLCNIVDSIQKEFLNEPYDALHYRNKEFPQKLKLNDSQILQKISKYTSNSSSKLLYIATDNYDQIFNEKTISKYPTKIISIKDIPISKYLNNIKLLPLIELIICIRSNIFIGTNHSTFTSEIFNNRLHKYCIHWKLGDFINNDPNNYLIN